MLQNYSVPRWTLVYLRSGSTVRRKRLAEKSRYATLVSYRTDSGLISALIPARSTGGEGCTQVHWRCPRRCMHRVVLSQQSWRLTSSRRSFLVPSSATDASASRNSGLDSSKVGWDVRDHLSQCPQRAVTTAYGVDIIVLLRTIVISRFCMYRKAGI